MTRSKVLAKLYMETMAYAQKATFSRVAKPVHAAVGAFITAEDATPDYFRGYLDAMIQMVDLTAPESEACAMGLVLSACKALIEPDSDPRYSGASVAFQQLEGLLAA